MKKPYLVGISGGSGSGKTSFIKGLQSQFGEEKIAIVSQDNYYLPKSKQQKDGNGWYNFDLPTAIDRERFFDDLLALSQHRPIEKHEYNFNNAEKKPETIVVQPAPIIVMEGLFIFYYHEIWELLDLTLFIDVKDEIKLQRRIKRDQEERGYPKEEVMYQWDNHVMPCYEKYLLPYRSEAHMVINNNYHFERGLAVLSDHLEKVLTSEKVVEFTSKLP